MLNNSFKSKRTKYESLNKNTDTYFQISAAQSQERTNTRARVQN